MRAGNDGANRKQGGKVHMAIDTLDRLLVLHVTATDAQDQAQVEHLAQQVQAATEESVTPAFVDQGYTGGTACPTGRRTLDAARSGQAAAGQKGLCAVVPAPGRRAPLRVGGPLSPPGAGLGTTAHGARWDSFRGVCPPQAETIRHVADPKYIARSRPPGVNAGAHAQSCPRADLRRSRRASWESDRLRTPADPLQRLSASPGPSSPDPVRRRWRCSSKPHRRQAPWPPRRRRRSQLPRR